MNPVRVVEGIEIYRGNAPATLRALLYEGHRAWARWFGPVAVGSLEEGLRRWKRPSEAAYFLGRESNPTQARAVELARRHLSGAVLDVGCGVGHLLRELGPGAVGLDSSFVNLYLARKFVVPAARLVCADVAQGLPFEDRSIDGLICAEAFVYMPGRARLAAELLRVWNRRSGLVLSHLDRKPTAAGTPATPEEILALFPGGRIEPETGTTFTLIVGPAPGGGA